MKELYYMVLTRPKGEYNAAPELALQTKSLEEANNKCREINGGTTHMAKVETWTKVK